MYENILIMLNLRFEEKITFLETHLQFDIFLSTWSLGMSAIMDAKEFLGS